MRHPRAMAALLATAAGAALAFLGGAQGQQVIRNGFESRKTAWTKGPADAVVPRNRS